MLEFIENNVGTIITYLATLAGAAAAIYNIYYRVKQKLAREEGDKIRLWETITKLNVEVGVLKEQFKTIEITQIEMVKKQVTTDTILNSMIAEFRKDFDELKKAMNRFDDNLLKYFSETKKR